MPDLLTSLRQSLGLAEDADEATILAAHTQALTERADPPAAPAVPQLPAGYVVVPEERLQALEVAASSGARAAEHQRVTERDRYLGEAIRAGKLIPARKAHFAGLMDVDETGTREFIDSIKAGAAVPLAPVGHDGMPETDAAEVDNAVAQWVAMSTGGNA